MTISNSDERTLSNDEAAAYLGCAPGTLRNWVSRKRVSYFKVGRLTRFRKSDLDGFLDRNKVEARTS